MGGNSEVEMFARVVLWRGAKYFPIGDGGDNTDILYLTEKGRAGVLKSASMRDWRWLVEKYRIKYWTYLKDLMLF